MMHRSEMIEPLDRRNYLAVSLDSAGWTNVTQSADSNVIYVSSSTGSDANNGLSAASPVQTLSRAQSLVRAGYPDWVLLKRGDTFGTFGEWRKWGRSAQEPMYISAYGTGARPQINTGTGWGFITYARNGAAGQSIDNLIVSSLSFSADTYNGTNGTIDTSAFRLYCQGQNVTIEDCKITGYREGLALDPGYNGLRNVAIRRNVITDSYALPGGVTTYNAHGLWIGGASNEITIEQNVIDHNGWRDGMNSERTFYNHDVYVYNSAQNVVVRENLITRASFYGIKMNGGGTAYNNFFARNSESIYLEHTALIESNVFTEAVAMPTQNWGVAINTQKAPSATIRKNLVAKNDNTNASGVAGIQLFNNGTPFSGLVEENVVYNWRNGIKLATPGNGVGSVIVRNNQSQLHSSSSAAVDQSLNGPQSTFAYSGNTYYSMQSTGANRINGTFLSLANWKSTTGESNAQYLKLTYPDSSRDIARYATVVNAGTTFETFIAAARAMDKSNWNPALMAPAVNDWFRGGFGMAPISVPVITSASFANQTLPVSVNFTFSGDIGSAPPIAALVLLNQTTGQTVAANSVSYDAPTRTVKFFFNSSLPEGRYLATYDGGYSFSFASLAGDGDGDAKVTTGDFNLLVSNFGGSGKTFAQGDFNYDTLVNSADFSIFLSQYGKSFPAAAASAPTVFSANGESSEDELLELLA
jgi:hypothetical protein